MAGLCEGGNEPPSSVKAIWVLPKKIVLKFEENWNVFRRPTSSRKHLSFCQRNMDEKGERIRSLIESVEKQMAWEEETRREAGAVRRQLFREEEIIRLIDSIESDVEEEDMVEEIDHNTDSAQSADEEVELDPGPIYTGKDGVTTWEMHCPLRNRRVGEPSHLNLFDLWSADGTGVPYFRTCMNRIRFKFLVTVLRFDDSNTRQERRSVDKLAPIRSLFEQIVQKCSENFTVSEYVTIDEMLESFRGRCSFKQFIKTKPARYGIKVFSLACAKTFYTLNMEVYAGKQPEGPYQVDNSAKCVVNRMVQPISGSRRNVTTDKWFTSVPLADELLRTHKLTLVGTLRKNKREVPPLFLQSRSMENSSVFGFTKDKTLLSYCPKKKKVVLLLSTMHHTDEIDPDSEESRKPYMLTFYNSTKGGVDMVDE
ncbi:hypothetical protein ANN_09041 [Periplaneta americana]|uniref:PiggyBac transposable element-derived protein domain-containing protein n=1 Tax=Periplaneta americana TaxID=6978 RepID=A0ABQ8TM19_PERAM|nr:hypothetical protein ANN_09041 [Periplaneta americana]